MRMRRSDVIRDSENKDCNADLLFLIYYSDADMPHTLHAVKYW